MKQPLPAFLEKGDLSSITTYQTGVMQSAAHRILQKKCDTVLKNYGISRMQWLIIGTIVDAGKHGVRITELAEKLGTTLPYLTTTINTLESKDILARRENHHDSRSKLVIVAPDFVTQCQEIELVLRQSLDDSVYKSIDPTDLRIYMKVLFQLGQISDT